jgi:hypothetical protein
MGALRAERLVTLNGPSASNLSVYVRHNRRQAQSSAIQYDLSQ